MNHTITLKRNQYNDGWKAETFIVIRQLRNTYFGAFSLDRDDVVDLFPRASVIDNHGGTGSEMASKGSIDVTLGDTLTLQFGTTDRKFLVLGNADGYNANLLEVSL